MSIKFFINDLVEVPGPMRDHYRKNPAGKFVLDVEGHPDTAKVSEFRTNNIRLARELEELRPLKAMYEGIDPDRARAALATSADLTAKLAAFDGVDPEEYRVLKARPDAAELEAELATQRAALATEREAHASANFKNLISTEFLRQGGRESAIDYMTTLASNSFAKDGTTTETSTTNPGIPLTVKEWVEAQSRVSDFAFQPSRGGNTPRIRHTLGVYPQQNELRDPTPQQLGEHAAEISSGRMRIVHTL